MKALFNRLFPARMDNTFDGHRAALWLLGLFIALKLAMSVNSILSTASVALGQLTLAVIALIALIRYRAMVPLMYLVLLGEQLARRLIVQGYAVERTEAIAVGWYVNVGLLALLTIGLVLSLTPARRR